MSTGVRQRAGKAGPAETPSATGSAKATSSGGISLVEVLRTITFLFFSSCALSWLITGKDFWWGHRPSYTRYDFWKSLATGPLQLTDAQLKAYDGSDPEKPIYLAINGTIYDVSAGRKFYGPGGSYDFFSGRDASRAFVTSCFDSDAQFTWDLRDVEVMHLPITSPEVDAQYTSGQLKTMKEQEMRQAKKKVKESLDHWIGFFSSSGKYKTVGTVKRAPGWEKTTSPPPLCEAALEKRPVRPSPDDIKAAVQQAAAAQKAGGPHP